MESIMSFMTGKLVMGVFIGGMICSTILLTTSIHRKIEFEKSMANIDIISKQIARMVSSPWDSKVRVCLLNRHANLIISGEITNIGQILSIECHGELESKRIFVLPYIVNSREFKIHVDGPVFIDIFERDPEILVKVLYDINTL